MFSVSVPACVQSHPAFQPNITRSEAEFVLALPGRKFVLRVNSETSSVVVTLRQASGAICHSEIAVENSGQVCAANKVYPSIDAFVDWLRLQNTADDEFWPFPSVGELRRIPQLSHSVGDRKPSKDEMRASLARMPFLIWPSAKQRAWVVTRFQPGTTSLVHLFVRPAADGRGFVVNANAETVFDSFLGLLEQAGLVPRAAPTSSNLHASLSDVRPESETVLASTSLNTGNYTSLSSVLLRQSETTHLPPSLLSGSSSTLFVESTQTQMQSTQTRNSTPYESFH